MNHAGAPSAKSAGARKTRVLRWGFLFLAAAAVRVYAMATESAYLHPDATWQAIEPAFRVLHGPIESMGLPWEFVEGVRSWAWPAALLGPMWLGERLFALLAEPDPAWWTTPAAGAIFGARLFCVGVDLVTLWGLRVALERASRQGEPVVREPQAARRGDVAWWAGLVFALHPVFAIPATQPLIDIPAAAALVWTIALTLVWLERPERSRTCALGAAAVFAILLRVQLLPSIAATLIMAFLAARRRTMKLDWRAALAGGLAVVFVFVSIDLWSSHPGKPLTWWFDYLSYNAREGTRAFGTMPVRRYLEHGRVVFGLVPLMVLLGLVAWGGRRALWLSIPAAALVLSHQVLPYRVWRFLHPALPLLIGAGAMGAARISSQLGKRSTAYARLGAILLLGTALFSAGESWVERSLWKTTWLYNEGGMLAVRASAALNEALLWCSARVGDASSPASKIAQWALPGAGFPGLAFVGADVIVDSPLGEGRPPAVPQPGELWIVPEQGRKQVERQGFLWVHDVSGGYIVAQRR
jgi:hypothetical protein